MRLLVLSDSHSHIERMSLAAKQAKPDVIIHLGDYITDAQKLQVKFPNVTMYMVKGNCDVNAAGEKELMIMIEGVKIFMTHGHKYNVKMGLTSFVCRAQETDAGIALYGHTHRAMIDRVNGMYLMNPGQMERHDGTSPATYGAITIEKGKVAMELKILEDEDSAFSFHEA